MVLDFTPEALVRYRGTAHRRWARQQQELAQRYRIWGLATRSGDEYYMAFAAFLERLRTDAD